MANRRVGDIAEDLAAVVDFVRQSANGARSGEIAEALKDIPQRTLQRWPVSYTHLDVYKRQSWA